MLLNEGVLSVVFDKLDENMMGIANVEESFKEILRMCEPVGVNLVWNTELMSFLLSLPRSKKEPTPRGCSMALALISVVISAGTTFVG